MAKYSTTVMLCMLCKKSDLFKATRVYETCLSLALFQGLSPCRSGHQGREAAPGFV